MLRLKIPFRSTAAWRATLVAFCVGSFGVAAPLPAFAQAVIQPLPPPEVGALDSALRRLAADPRNVQALIDAGYAALGLNDADAAIGFFSRASEIAPQSARAKAGLGSAFVRSENPYDAMLLFEEALRLGATPASLAADRGLASDLVGDAQSAQAFYRQALAAGPNDEIARRLALSLAVSGKRNDMEDVLLPLLKKSDLAAFRTRAFGLAILGDAKEASDIVDTIMPKDMAKRIKPYLKQLPRLTPAQQIAAGSFGHFPSEKNIGADDPRFARYGATSRAMATQPATRAADAGLIPSGEPLGAKGKAVASARPERPPTRAEKARAERAARGQQLAVAAQPMGTAASAPPARAVQAARSGPTQELAPVAPRPGFSSITPPPAPAPVVAQIATQLPPAPSASPTRPPVALSTVPSSANLGLPQSGTAQAPVTPPALVTAAPSAPSAATMATAAVSPVAAASPAATRFSAPAAPVAQAPASMALAGPSPAAVAPTSVPAATLIYSPASDPISTYTPQAAAPPPAAAPEQKFTSVADAFSSFDVATPAVTILPGAVDLATIKVAREAPPAPKADPKVEAEKPGKETLKETAKAKAAREAKEKAAKEKAEKEKVRKANPSRFWVQVGTGRNKAALAFDWRRMNKDNAALFKGHKPYVTAWGQTNRLLVGPFPNDAAARDFLKKLKAANYDSFTFASAEGQEVEVLGASR